MIFASPTRKVDLPCDVADTAISDCEARAGGSSRWIDILFVRITPFMCDCGFMLTGEFPTV